MITGDIGPTFLVCPVAIALIVQAVGLHQDTWGVFQQKRRKDVDGTRKHQYGLKLLFNCFLPKKIMNEQQENSKK